MKLKVMLFSTACLAICAGAHGQAAFKDAPGNSNAIHRNDDSGSAMAITGPNPRERQPLTNDDKDDLHDSMSSAVNSLNSISCSDEDRSKITSIDQRYKGYYLDDLESTRTIEHPSLLKVEELHENRYPPDKVAVWVIRHKCGWSTPNVPWVYPANDENLGHALQNAKAEYAQQAQQDRQEQQEDRRLGAIKRQSDAAFLEMINNQENALGNPGETPKEAAESRSNGTKCNLAGKAKVAYWDHLAKHMYYNDPDPHASDFVQSQAFMVRTKCKWRAPNAPWIIPTN